MPDESLAAGRTNAGLEVTDRQTDALVMGLDREITHEKLRIAVDVILNGAAFIGAHPDLLLPTAGAFEPGGRSYDRGRGCRHESGAFDCW
ncbi:ribonucleotide monophosphatase NagD (HAD superfamily) [Bradyrhizobium sp. GM0.4]